MAVGRDAGGGAAAASSYGAADGTPAGGLSADDDEAAKKAHDTTIANTPSTIADRCIPFELRGGIPALTFLCYCFGYMAWGYTYGLIGPTFDFFKDHLHTTYNALGLVPLARMAGAIIGSFVAGWCIDNGAGHGVFIGGFLVAQLACASISVVTSLRQLLACFFVGDLGFAFMLCAIKVFSSWTAGPKVDFVMNGTDTHNPSSNARVRAHTNSFNT